MDLLQNVRFLEQTSLFRGLSRDELKPFARTAECRQAEHGKTFFEQGTPADALYILRHGRVKIVQTTHDGLRALLRFVGPRELFGSAALLADQTYEVSAAAVTWTQSLCWRRDIITRLMSKHPVTMQNALGELSMRVRELRRRFQELATERVEQRVAQALVELGEQAGWKTDGGLLIDIPLSRQDLAEMTGTTLYTVSRILHGWHLRGLVQAGRQRVSILSSDGLLAVANHASA